MPTPLILASASQSRAALLRAAGLEFTSAPARIDEAGLTRALRDENVSPRDLADTLADHKARKVSARHDEAFVLGCDQVLSIQDRIFGKPETPDDAIEQLRFLRNATHRLYSAAVIYRQGGPLWRHVGVVSLTMRNFSDGYLRGYVDRNWGELRHCAGAYQIEAEGARLFTAVTGDYFTVLGLPLLPVLDYLITAEVIES